MTGLETLVVPILVSAVFVFVASAFVHTGPTWHRSDYPKVPNEDAVRDALRPLAIPPGEYMVPRCSSAEMKSPEFQKKLADGPVLMMTVMPNGPFTMGKSLFQWFVYVVVVSFFAAYVAGRALAPDAHYLEVFRFVGATSFIAYTVGLWQMSIWYKRSWAMSVKYTVDGLIYSLLTAGAFGWLWPN